MAGRYILMSKQLVHLAGIQRTIDACWSFQRYYLSQYAFCRGLFVVMSSNSAQRSHVKQRQGIDYKNYHARKG